MNTEPPESFVASPPPLVAASAAVMLARRLLAGWRLAGTPAGLTLVFDGAVFAAMAVLGWKLVTPWSDALSAGESLMVIGLIVCAGLWASICAEDLYRWRKLCRRWSAHTRRQRPAAADQAVPVTVAVAKPVGQAVGRPRVRSAVWPAHRSRQALNHTPWHVVTRH